MLRRMKKPELVGTCKRNGIKGYSRLNKMDIVEMIEKFKNKKRRGRGGGNSYQILSVCKAQVLVSNT